MKQFALNQVSREMNF